MAGIPGVPDREHHTHEHQQIPQRRRNHKNLVPIQHPKRHNILQHHHGRILLLHLPKTNPQQQPIHLPSRQQPLTRPVRARLRKLHALVTFEIPASELFRDIPPPLFKLRV